MGAIATAAAWGAAIGGGYELLSGGDLGDVAEGALIGGGLGAAGGAAYGAFAGEAALGGAEIFGPAMESGAMGTTGAFSGVAGELAWDGMGAVPAGFEGFGMGADGSIAAMDTLGSTNWFSSAMNAGLGGGGESFPSGISNLFSSGGGGKDGGGGSNWMNYAIAGMGIYSGIKGIGMSEEMRKRAEQDRALALKAAQEGPEWQKSGGRGLADAQLQQLMRDPGQVAAQDPSFGLRIQGAQRATAMYGQNSGAMSVAGANASTDWYNQRLAQLGQLADAPGRPTGTIAGAAQLGQSGEMAANDLYSRSLASIGYGVNRGVGGSGQYTPEMIARMRAAGARV